MDPLLLPWSKPLQHVSTLVRQFLFDLIFIMENVVLLSIALNSNIIELKVNYSLKFSVTMMNIWIKANSCRAISYSFFYFMFQTSRFINYMAFLFIKSSKDNKSDVEIVFKNVDTY